MFNFLNAELDVTFSIMTVGQLIKLKFTYVVFIIPLYNLES